VACSNYPECKFTRKFAQPGGNAEGGDDEGLGKDPETGMEIMRRTGRFGPYIQLGEGKEAKRASIPKDIDELTLEWGIKLLSLPRTVGPHPETGKDITASIGRYGPDLAHDGKYARLRSTAEVFDTGMNAAVVKLAEAASGAGKARGGSREPIAVLGAHPVSGKELKVMEGRYGPYVSDGETHATLPKSADPKAVTLEEAVDGSPVWQRMLIRPAFEAEGCIAGHGGHNVLDRQDGCGGAKGHAVVSHHWPITSALAWVWSAADSGAAGFPPAAFRADTA